MKRYFHSILAICMIAFLGLNCTSCTSDDEDEITDQTQYSESALVGYWKNNANSDNWHFKSDKTGVYWDSEESTEDEAYSEDSKSGYFKWYIDNTGLMVIHYMESTNSFSDPDVECPFYILALTSSTFTYRTSGGEQGTWTRYK